MPPLEILYTIPLLSRAAVPEPRPEAVFSGLHPIRALGRAASQPGIPLSTVPWALGPDTFFPSFFQSWCSCPAQERSLGSAIFSRNRGLERQGRRVRAAPWQGPLCSSFTRVVPVFPVLRDPGLQLLPRGLEVLLEEGLQLRPGHAVVVGAGQRAEVLQDLVWAETRGVPGTRAPSLMGGPGPCCLWWGTQEQAGSRAPYLERRTAACPRTACRPGRAWPSAFGAGAPRSSKSGCRDSRRGERVRPCHVGRRRTWALCA